MGRNLEEQRRELNGIIYYNRGTVQGEDGSRYDRFAIRTHFVEVGESHVALVEKYVLPLYQQGDVLSFGAKVMAMCTGNVHRRADVKPGFFANLMWRFAANNSTGIGMHEPHKLQLVINQVGLPRVLLAAFLSAVTKPFGVKGVFYKVCGKDVGGIDGFYHRSDFAVYHDLALVNNDNGNELCNEIHEMTGVPTILMDANDFDRNVIGISDGFPLTNQEIQDAMQDNPSGQGDELTPLILIRPL